MLFHNDPFACRQSGHRRARASIRALAAVAALMTCSTFPGCAESTAHLQPYDEAAESECNTEYNRENGLPGCWVELYAEQNLTGPCIRVWGPVEVGNMDFEPMDVLDGDIESIRVGPAAELILYEDVSFEDQREELAARVEIRDMDETAIDDAPQSFRIRYIH